ncbi:MAG: dienelactone hydrolase family protein [Chloroflexi bacterium]|nr:dienelactone hydrolase family protein [Chloroflexota bacterium]
MCYDLDARPPIPPISGAAGDGQDIVITASDGNRFSAYMSRSPQPKGAEVLIFPDVRGLHAFYKELALRFADIGVPALAIDYFGRTAGISPRDENFEYRTHVDQMQMPTFLNDVAAALAYLRDQNKTARAPFIVGFCRGGALALLTGAENFDLLGIIAFYPGMSRQIPGSKGTVHEQASKIRCPVLGLFGGADANIPATDVQKLDEQLAVAGVKHELVTYPGATHSFFDRRATEFAEQSADAWRRVQSFIT